MNQLVDGMIASFESRACVLDLDGCMKPDIAGVTLSSLNFMHGASINEPEIIRRLAVKMLVNGIKPELEIFDLRMVNVAHAFIKERLIQGAIFANILLGNIAGAQTSVNHVLEMLSSISDDWTVCLAGLGDSQLTSNIMGITYANGDRVGLEDNLWLDRAGGVLAKNSDMVKRVCKLSSDLGRGLAKDLKELFLAELNQSLFDKNEFAHLRN